MRKYSKKEYLSKEEIILIIFIQNIVWTKKSLRSDMTIFHYVMSE